MNLKDFMVLVKDLNAEAEDTLDVANKEYATEESKFNNFELTANIIREMNPRLKQIQAEDVALIFMMKHLFSIAAGVSLREDMRGRYKDCLNYIHLHHGIYQEKRQQSQKEQIPIEVSDTVKRPRIREQYPNLEDNTAFPKEERFLTNDPNNIFYMRNEQKEEDFTRVYNGDPKIANDDVDIDYRD